MENPIELPDVEALAEKARAEKDRAIAMAVVSKGTQRGAAAEVARDLGISRVAVSRAMRRQGDWARAEHERARPNDSEEKSEPGSDHNAQEVTTESEAHLSPEENTRT